MPEAKVRTIIIIKKKKGGGHGHHGGAWKVAFADFMTAMFALFLVLWILTQSQDVKEAVASYFRHPTDYEGKPDALLRGNEGLMDHKQGRLDNESNSIEVKVEPNTAGGEEGEKPGTKATSINGGKGQQSVPKAIQIVEDADDVKTFLDLADKLWDMLEGAPSFSKVKGNFLIQALEEGLLIQVIEQPDAPLFEEGQDVFKTAIKQALAVIAKEIGKRPNKLELDGHGKSVSGFYGEKQKWMASTYLADVTRVELERGGLRPQQVFRVSGCGDSRPLGPGINKRICILVRPRQWQDRY